MTSAPTKAGAQGNAPRRRISGPLKAQPDVILTSPLPRAAQTADIAATALKVRIPRRETAHTGIQAEVARLLRSIPASLDVVGHEPDLRS